MEKKKTIVKRVEENKSETMRTPVTQPNKRRALQITVFISLFFFCLSYGVAFADPKFSKLDPYGLAKDKRMVERGNRGRPVWEASQQTDGPGEKDPACFSNAHR